MSAAIVRQFLAWTTGLFAIAFAWWSCQAISDQPHTTYGGAHPGLLWLEVAGTAGLIVSGAFAMSGGHTAAGALFGISGVAWLAPELSGVVGQMPFERSVAGMVGWLVLPTVAGSLLLFHLRPASLPSSSWIAFGTLFGAATLVAITQVDPFLDSACWHSCLHNPAAIPAIAGWEPGLRWAATVQVCMAGIVAIGLHARRTVRPPGANPRVKLGGPRPVIDLLVVAAVLCSLIVAALIRQVSTESPDSIAFRTVNVAAQLAALGLSFTIGWDVIRKGQLHRALRRLVYNLESTRTPQDLALALSQALGDVLLEMAYWLPATSTWVDADGCVAPDRSAAHGRAFTTILRDGSPVARIVHSDRVRTRDLDAALGPALRLAIENACLQTASLVELADLRASRQRIVERSDAERLILERNLHDGVQQRVVSLALLFGMMRSQLAETSPHAAEAIQRAADIPDALLGELRSIARGIYPPMLGEAGLLVAVSDLAESWDDVDISVDAPTARFASNVEAATYFMIDSAVRDAVQRNAARVDVVLSQRAGRLVFEVRDDGFPSTEPAALQLADRVGALDGALTVSSPENADEPNTSVHVEVPCGS